MTEAEVVEWVLSSTTVRWVCGGGDSSVAYTAGYWSQGLPELVAIGLSHRDAVVMLNRCGALQKHTARPWVPSDLDVTLYTMPIKFGPVSDRWVAEWMTLSRETHPAGGPVVQVLWPDRRGIFPDEPGYSTEFYRQTIAR